MLISDINSYYLDHHLMNSEILVSNNPYRIFIYSSSFLPTDFSYEVESTEQNMFMSKLPINNVE